MSWLFSQALVGEYLAATFLDGEPCVPSSGNPIQQAYCAPDKMTDFSRLSRFGMTYKPLTEDRGEALLTLYREVFHAKTLAQQDEAQGLTESEAECGEKWRGSFTRYDPDSSLWRTHQCSLLGDWEPFSETWPKWGLMRDGECWEQSMLVPRISVTEFGFVPNDEDFFHTPNTTGMDGGSNSRRALKKRKEMWPTPRALEIEESYEGYIDRMKRSGNPKNVGKTRPQNLSMAVKMWTTPVTSDHAARRPTQNWAGTDLPSQVWVESGGRENPNLPPARLSPNWVEWLMGWPIGWTDLKPLAMDRFQKWQDEHGSC